MLLPAISPPIRPLLRAEFDRLVELGAFGRERLELIHGSLVSMSPIGPNHCGALDALADLLRAALQGRARVRTQMPFLAGQDSEPEPDIAVVPLGSYRHQHPAEAALLVEVADSSLDYDRDVKAPLYAQSRVAEYWILNLRDRCIEVYRDSDGVRWRTAFVVDLAGSAAPTQFPDLQISVSQVL